MDDKIVTNNDRLIRWIANAATPGDAVTLAAAAMRNGARRSEVERALQDFLRFSLAEYDFRLAVAGR